MNEITHDDGFLFIDDQTSYIYPNINAPLVNVNNKNILTCIIYFYNLK
jgi:hypothetical protein